MEKFKILVIDDEPGNIDAIITALKKENYEILIATNGNTGYKIAQKTSPNLIITDWEMPGFSGIETIKLIKTDKSLCNIPIIMATGKKIESFDLQTALNAGANDYIRKPIDKIELIARVRSMILLFETMEKNTQLQKEKQQKLKIEIKKNKRELSSITLKLVQQSKFNIQLIEKLSEAYKFSDNEGKKIINDISNNCKLFSNTNYWEEFEHTFNQVHPAFYKKLNSKFPDLTKGERKLAAFFRLNMSSKEIASITFQSESSLKKARQRLRKKININSDTELCVFFQSL